MSTRISTLSPAAEAARVYRGILAEASREADRSRGRLRGLWRGGPAAGAADLERAIAAAEAAPGKILKSGPRIRVLRATLFGRDALVKRYDLSRLSDRAKYLFRPSRARRAWAAGRALARLGIPTPEPLGFLEVYAGPVAVRSYAITAFMPDARSARKWIKPWFARQSPPFREAFRQELLETLLTLYRKGVYHADTKAANLLLRAPEDPARRAFFWIDLECVKFGVVPTRHQIVRNLVQLNGSLGSKVSEDDRMAFLRDMAAHYPWLMKPDVAPRIRAWTRRRLLKELRLWCGS